MSQQAPGGNGGGGLGHESGTQTAMAVVLVVVLVVVGFLLLHHKEKVTASSGATTSSVAKGAVTTVPGSAPATVTVPPTTIAPATIKLQVLNGLQTGSLAGEWSKKLQTNPGYDTLSPENTTARTTTDAIYIVTAGYLPEAQALAQAVGLPASAINQTTPPPSSAHIPTSVLKTANLVLVIGSTLAPKANA